MNSRHSRRDFLKLSSASLAAVALPAVVPSAALGRGAEPPPSGRINVAAIGVGPQGRGVMGGFLGSESARVVAVCDVNTNHLNAARDQVNQRYGNQECATFHDFRELLARPEVDAVSIATPDHWHVPVAIAAAKAGKDMYLEKPMGLSLAEDQALREIVKKKQRVFQFGTQQRSSREFRFACELVRSGRIGQLKNINVWCSASRPGGSNQPAPAPEGLDYEFWLGPAPSTPHTEDKCVDGKGWKTWWFNSHYALGFIAGWGVHPLDIAQWGHPAMFAGPMLVEGRGVFPQVGACDTAVAWEVKFTFHDRVTMNFRGVPNNYDGNFPMNDFSEWKAKYRGIADHGTAFEGTEGWVMVHRGGLRTGPEKLAETPESELWWQLPKSGNHVQNFLDSVKSRTPAICNIDEAVKADVLCQLSDAATRLGGPLLYDSAVERFVENKEANRYLALRPAREPWKRV